MDRGGVDLEIEAGPNGEINAYVEDRESGDIWERAILDNDLRPLRAVIGRMTPIPGIPASRRI